MNLRRRLVNLVILAALVSAGGYLVWHSWRQGAGALPASALLTTSRSPAVATSDHGASTAASASAGNSANGGGGAQNALAAARLARAQAESRELDELRAMAQDKGTTATVRAQAQEEILQLEQMQEEEALAEVVLGAKGMGDAVVVLHAGGAAVLLPPTGLDAATAARAAQAVAAVAGLDPSQVQVVPTS